MLEAIMQAFVKEVLFKSKQQLIKNHAFIEMDLTTNVAGFKLLSK